MVKIVRIGGAGGFLGDSSVAAPQLLKGGRLDYMILDYLAEATMSALGQLKAARPDLKIATTEPAGAAMLNGADWAPHKIQGWTPNLVPSVLDKSVYDINLPVTDEVARDTARDLATQEGIFCGISSGGTFAAALQVAREHASAGDAILAMLPDTGERYLSTFLFEGVNEGSDDEWLATL